MLSQVPHPDTAGVFARSAQSLVHKVSVTASVTIDVCRSYGMRPNLQPGKTEALLDLRGPGSRILKQQLYTGRTAHARRL